MAAIAENLDWCVRNAVQESDDAENVKICLEYTAKLLNISCLSQLHVSISICLLCLIVTGFKIFVLEPLNCYFGSNL